MQQSTLPPTPFAWRIALAIVVVALTVAATFGGGVLGAHGQSALGVLCFLSIAAMFSANLRALNWRTIGFGFALQVLLALFVLKFEIGGVRPGYEFFNLLGGVAKKFLAFSDEGAKFVFGKLADPAYTEAAFQDSNGAGGSHRADLQNGRAARFGPARRLSLRLPCVADHHLRVRVFQRAVLLRRAAIRRADHGPHHGVPDAHQRRGNVVGDGQRLHGPDGSAAHGQTLRREDDAIGTAHPHGRRHGAHLRRSDGRLHRLRRRSGGDPGHQRHGVAVQPVPGQNHDAGDGAAADARDRQSRCRSKDTPMSSTPPPPARRTACVWRSTSRRCSLPSLPSSPSPTPCSNSSTPICTLASIFGYVFLPVAYLLGISEGDAPKVANLLGTKLVLNEFVAYLNFKGYAPGMEERTRRSSRRMR